MIRSLIAALLTLAAAGIADAQTPGQPGSERPSLKSEVIVSSDIVRIGDLIDNAGIVANVPIFRAPDLGSTGTVSVEAVLEAVRNQALIGVETNGIRDVVVTRASRTVPAKEVEDAITRALSTRFDIGPSKDIVVTLARDVRAIYVDPSAKGVPHVTQINFDSYSGRFEATIEIPTTVGKRNIVQLAGRAVATVEIATVVRTVERGTTLKEADVIMERRPRAEVGRGFVTDRGQAVGFAARGALQPGRPLRFAELMKPDLVQRNEAVTLVYEVPGIMLSVRGKAIDGGAEGDVISVLNEQSKRTVQGTIIGPGRVVVGGAPRRLANNTGKSPDNADVR